ncbi:MAG: DNA topoisomerase III [Negativicutes bacterium]|jgi:DNA topoisomerase-3
MKLIIAEKPSLGRAIAEWLGSSYRKSGYIECKNDYVVTWVFGHMLELYEPGDYFPDWKSFSCALPMIPEKFINKLREDGGVKQQVFMIKELLNNCSEVIHAGDPDREGQLLVDEVLDYLQSDKPVGRLWLAAIDDLSIKRAFATLKPNAEYVGYKAAAEVRQQSDWLIGMNYSRAFKRMFDSYGYHTSISIGRVQTPTLKLIIDRDKEIANFKDKTFYELQATFRDDSDNKFDTKLVLPDAIKPLLDDENKLLDKQPLLEIVAKIINKTGKIASYSNTRKSQRQPLLFNLSDLQIEANKKFGLTAQQVLDLAQTLYENKLASYPRTDCQYMPVSQFEDAPNVLKNLLRLSRYKTLMPDASIRSAVWNDEKIFAHHAIVPTGANLTALEELTKKYPDIKNVFHLISVQYLAQFYPEMLYDEVEILVDVEQYQFRAIGKTIVNLGWKSVFVATAVTSTKKDEDNVAEENDAEMILPVLANDQPVLCVDTKLFSKKATKPKHYTEGTLIKAMTNIHSRVPELVKQMNYDAETSERLIKEYRAILKESSGLGTEATRAGIIENLYRKKFIDKQKKYLIGTELGATLIGSFTAQQETSQELGFLANPLTTAVYEMFLDDIVTECVAHEFSSAAKKFWDKLYEQLNNIGIFSKLSFDMQNIAGANLCLVCERVIKRFEGKYGAFWKCMACGRSYKDKDGMPILDTVPNTLAVELNKKCPVCDEGNLVERTSKYGKFIGCNKFPKCTYKN